MKTRRAFLKGFAALASAAQMSGHLPAHSAETVPQAARQRPPELKIADARADSLVEFISVQTHLNWRDGIWDQPAWRPLLGELGVRYTRSALGNRKARDHLLALFQNYGIRSSVTFNPINEDGTFKQDATLRTLDFMREQVGAEKIYAIEGPNEYTHKHKVGDWPGRLRSYQEFLYNAVKSDAELSAIAVLAPTIWKRIVEDYEAIANMEAHADYGNLHLYNAGRRPSLFNRNERDEPIDIAIREAQIVIPGKQVCITETGFNVADGVAPTKWTIPADIAAKYTLRNVAELFLRRDLVKRINIYSLIDDDHPRDRYGLLDINLKPRPAYAALRNFIAMVADPGPDFALNPLNCKIAAVDPNVRWLALQKRDGRFLVLLWLDAASYDRKAAAANDVPPSPVTLDFGRSIASLKTYAPTISNAVVQELTAVSSASLEVPDHVMVAEIVL